MQLTEGDLGAEGGERRESVNPCVEHGRHHPSLHLSQITLTRGRGNVR